jgi:hypothetical protein
MFLSRGEKQEDCLFTHPRNNIDPVATTAETMANNVGTRVLLESGPSKEQQSGIFLSLYFFFLKHKEQGKKN